MKRSRTDLPRNIYPDDPWALLEDAFAPDFLYLTETIFAQSNGRIGVRGSLDEGRPHHIIGTYLNGFHETWPISHAENAYGLAQLGQTMVAVPDGLQFDIFVDGEQFLLPEIEILRCRRWLDFRTGLLEREIEWQTTSGVRIDLRFRRLVSFTLPNLFATRLELRSSAACHLRIVSRLVNRLDLHITGEEQDVDPRRAKQFTHRVLEPRAATLDGDRLVQGWVTSQSRLGLLSACDHVLTGPEPTRAYHRSAADFGFDYQWWQLEDEPITITKFVAHVDNGATPGLSERQNMTTMLDTAREQGFDGLARSQEERLTSFWNDHDIEIDADPELQRAVRWVLFQLFSSAVCVDGASIPAKGLTGHAYDGHYFWDTEIYVVPFLSYTMPDVARRILEHRYGMLQQARTRAEILNHPGALFPWRTINGEEASTYFLAGTAQYHIDADVVYAIRKYVQVTGDEEFLWEAGAEIAFETARFFADLGFYRYDKFHIHGVTGPDEYTALVDDNAYTNTMARMNLRFAVETAGRFRAHQPDRWEQLCERIGLDDDEVHSWSKAASAMYIPYDSGRAITPQDDDFLSKEPWDFENTPESKYPLLLHFHPLTIYRYQVLKQADVVLAQFLLGEEFSDRLKRANFDFYEPITTGDSSLSASIQAIVAAGLHYPEPALEHFLSALYMDLGDIAGNTSDGVHMASAGGVWMALIYGFAGMTDVRGHIRFDPRLPEGWNSMTFGIRVRGTLIRVTLDRHSMTFTARDEPVTVMVGDASYDLEPDRDLRVELDGSAGGPN